MDEIRNVDVVVPVQRGDSTILGRLRSILDLSGPSLGRLVVVDDGCADRGLADGLAELAAQESRFHHIRCARNLGWVEHCNRGLIEHDGDVVVLLAESVVTEGWLIGLAEAAHSEERTALATPVVLDPAEYDLKESEVRAAIQGLPLWTTTLRVGGSCNYLRGDALDAVGLLDTTFRSPTTALNDWLMRARELGFFAKRANRVYVVSTEDRAPRPESAVETADRAVLEDRHHHVTGQHRRFENSLDGSLARHAIEFQASDRLAVAYDLRHLPMEYNGTKVYAHSLGKALAAIPEIDLTLLVLHPIQAEGVPGRLVSPDDWADDVAVIHKPAQIFDPRHSRLLFESRAHVIITYQDLIAYRLPGVFETEDDYHAYQSTSRLTLQAAQGILAPSRCTAREIADEFNIPIDEVSPILHGVEVEAFAAAVGDAEEIKARLNLPSRYLLSLASDYPHKNMAGLLEAYAMLRHWWREGEPPALALAGHAPRTGAATHGLPGVLFLGSVSADELRILYQNADALVFPSLYEGFGMPPLEAMAAGAPVIAMPFSSVPEACGDAALYAESLSPIDLARAMRRLTADAELRDEHIAKGRRRTEELHWEATARSTFEVYRKAVLDPSSRSLEARRLLNEAIIRWSGPAIVEVVREVVVESPPRIVEVEVQVPTPVYIESDTIVERVEVLVEPGPMGVINACLAFRDALSRRVRRDLGHSLVVQRSRLARAKRLTRRFLDVSASDGLGHASRKAARKIRSKALGVIDRRDPSA